MKHIDISISDIFSKLSILMTVFYLSIIYEEMYGTYFDTRENVENSMKTKSLLTTEIEKN